MNRIHSWIVLASLHFSVFLVVSGMTAHAEPPIQEIRTIMAQKCLWSPSIELLNTLDAKNLQRGLRSIDPFASYIPPTSTPIDTLPTQILTLGIELLTYSTLIWIRPINGGPADRADLPEQGILRAIDNADVSNADLATVSSMLDSAMNKSKISLTISKKPNDSGKIYLVTPSKFKAPSVTWRQINKYLVIRIREFVAHDTAPSIRAIYSTLVKPASEVIIDLRGCTGGDLNEAIDIAGSFVSTNSLLISTYDRVGLIKEYKSPPGRKWPSPTLILIDRYTASSAEILSGTLRYYHLGRLIGEKTVGKCVSQVIIPLSDGGKLRFTDLLLQYPDKSTCSGKGLLPDIYYQDITVSNIADIIKKNF